MQVEVFIHGIFKEEIKNRFLCIVTVDDEDILCYVPSSCRLSNFIDMSGRDVLLVPVATKNARTKYSVLAVFVNNHYIPVNLSLINNVILEELPRRIFSFLGERKNIIKEKRIQDYKSDIYLPDSNTIIEVKSILSLETTAIFPTVYSERAVNQLVKLKQMLEDGYRVSYFIVSLNPRVKKIRINNEIFDYYRKIYDCCDSGMQLHAFSVILIANELKILKEIPIVMQ